MSKWGVRLMNSKPRAGPRVLADMLLAWRKRRWRSKNQRITLSGGLSKGILPFDNLRIRWPVDVFPFVSSKVENLCLGLLLDFA